MSQPHCLCLPPHYWKFCTYWPGVSQDSNVFLKWKKPLCIFWNSVAGGEASLGQEPCREKRLESKPSSYLFWVAARLRAHCWRQVTARGIGDIRASWIVHSALENMWRNRVTAFQDNSGWILAMIFSWFSHLVFPLLLLYSLFTK